MTAPMPGLSDTPSVPRRKVCLIGIDGLRHDIAIGEGAMPTLVQLAETGRFHPMTIAAPTWSGPSWSTILTGATIAEHGITDNSFVGSTLARHPDLLSRAFYADQSTTTFAAAAWPPLVDPHGLGPVIHERREQKQAGLHHVVVRDGETYGYRTADADIAQASLWMLHHIGPDASFIYLCEADEAAHGHGARSPEYGAALSRVNAHLDSLVAVLTDRQSREEEEWLIVVVTDHGHLDEGGHGGDTPIERAAFVVTRHLTGDQLDWPEQIEPSELSARILGYLARRD